jgi:branched-chain amino acid transport system ATP-binding protein
MTDALNPPILEVIGLSVRFGGVVALSNLSFSVLPRSIVGLIGPNGAGKTTIFNCLSRIYRPTSGDIRIDGKSVTHLPRHAMATLGVARTFQNVALFDELSVRDNVMTGAHSVSKGGFLAHALAFPSTRRTERELVEKARDTMAFMRIEDYADASARDLPFPIRKRVEFARALIADPRLLLLDEPAGGLNHDEVDVLRDQILNVRKRYDTAILLVEHHMSLVMSVSERVVAIDFGTKIGDGTPAEIRANPEVIRAYLGADAA